MKYLLLVYGNPVNWEHPVFAQHPAFLALSEAERAAIMAEDEAFDAELRASGELVSAAALADPSLTRTAHGGVVTDGPYLEAKEQLAGYFVLDCETPERAAEIAARFPDTRFSGVEIRPIMGMAAHEE